MRNSTEQTVTDVVSFQLQVLDGIQVSFHTNTQTEAENLHATFLSHKTQSDKIKIKARLKYRHQRDDTVKLYGFSLVQIC